MPNTRYRRGRPYAADMALFSRQMSGDNSRELSQLKRNLIRALHEDITEKQRAVLLLYYAEGYNMREIGEKMGVSALWGGGLSAGHEVTEARKGRGRSTGDRPRLCLRSLLL